MIRKNFQISTKTRNTGSIVLARLHPSRIRSGFFRLSFFLLFPSMGRKNKIQTTETRFIRAYLFNLHAQWIINEFQPNDLPVLLQNRILASTLYQKANTWCGVDFFRLIKTTKFEKDNTFYGNRQHWNHLVIAGRMISVALSLVTATGEFRGYRLMAKKTQLKKRLQTYTQ